MSWNFIPKIYIATLCNSKRIPIVTKSLDDMGVKNYEFNYQTPPLVKNRVNVTLSCSDNHLQIYKKALNENHPFICVFEDDVFTERKSSELPIILKNIERFVKTNDWGILYLGYFPWKIGRECQEMVYESISWCTHAYLITRDAMKLMCRYSPEQMLKIGRMSVPSVFDIIFPEGGGIDTFMAQLAYRNKIKSHCVYPMLIEQNSIPYWSSQSKIARQLSKGEWWPWRLFIALWMVYWIILGLIVK